MRKFAIFISSFVLFTVFFVPKVFAADIKISPAGGTYGVNKNFSVNILIDTAGSSINAAEAKLKFDPSVIKVQSISKASSIFSFWLVEPSFDNNAGTIDLIGGTPNGVSGSSLHIVTVTFTGATLGSSEVSFIKAIITASDGTGSDILGKALGANYSISSTGIGTTGTVTVPEPVPPPVQIQRTPTPATGIPSKPSIEVILYPDQTHWYNQVSNFTAKWALPTDIDGVSTVVNQNPNADAPQKSEGLFESKTFSALSYDGVYYLHVRFKNSRGWGPTGHYKISIDTQPPLPFNIDIPTGAKSDNPTPKLVFVTGDSLSGVASFGVTINTEPQVNIASGQYLFKPHPPGSYSVRVSATDKAGNSIEARTVVEIEPIESPKITFITRQIIQGSDVLFNAKGLAMPNTRVVVTMTDKAKFLIFNGSVDVNDKGEWEFKLNRDLRNGTYLFSAITQDNRGALSLPTEITVVFKDRPIIVLFGLEITLTGLIIILIIAGAVASLWFYRRTFLRLIRFNRESVIIRRDIKNAFDMVKGDLDKISDIANKESPSATKETEVSAVNKKIKETLDRIEKYSGEDIEKLK